MKQQIIKLIEEKLNESLKNLEQQTQSFRAAADLDEEATRDLDDFSQQSEDKDMEIRMSQQALKVAENINWLHGNGSTVNDIIQPGALVETSNAWLFFGIALPHMEVKGKKLIGVSEDAPAFAIMQGKKKGEKIKLGKEELTIDNIY